MSSNRSVMTTERSHALEQLADYPFDDLVEGLGSMFGQGWFPRDLLALPDNDRARTALLVDLVSAHRQSWNPGAAPIWIEHAERLGAAHPWWIQSEDFWPQFLDRHPSAIPSALAAARWWSGIFLVGRRLHQFAPPPWVADDSSAGDHDHQKIMGKVRGLLAKAESTPYPEEAEALSAKAQELISQYSIDVALLADSVEVPGGTRLYLDAPYTKAKFMLLSGIADANRCQAVFNSDTDTATLVGFSTDVTLTEVLFTSLLVQGTSAILAAGPQTGFDGSSSTRSWRNSFWFGYARRVEERLVEAADATSSAAAANNEALLPVLASRSEAVTNTLEELFPKLGSLSVSVSNGAGLMAGRSFADQADLSKSALKKKTRRGLGR